MDVLWISESIHQLNSFQILLVTFCSPRMVVLDEIKHEIESEKKWIVVWGWKYIKQSKPIESWSRWTYFEMMYLFELYFDFIFSYYILLYTNCSSRWNETLKTKSKDLYSCEGTKVHSSERTHFRCKCFLSPDSSIRTLLLPSTSIDADFNTDPKQVASQFFPRYFRRGN